MGKRVNFFTIDLHGVAGSVDYRKIKDLLIEIIDKNVSGMQKYKISMPANIFDGLNYISLKEIIPQI